MLMNKTNAFNNTSVNKIKCRADNYEVIIYMDDKQ